MLAEIYGAVETEFQASQKEGLKTQLKLAARFGSLLAWLGLGEVSGEVSAERSRETGSVRISKVPITAKVNALIAYQLENNKRLPAYDIDNEQVVSFHRDGKAGGWGGFGDKDKTDGIGLLAGRFFFRRLEPAPSDATPSLVDDLLNKREHLWLCETSPSAPIPAEIPFLTTNFRRTSQSAIARLRGDPAKSRRIEAMGVLAWRNGTLHCDPIAWTVLD